MGMSICRMSPSEKDLAGKAINGTAVGEECRVGQRSKDGPRNVFRAAGDEYPVSTVYSTLHGAQYLWMNGSQVGTVKGSRQ
jgi:hypothetical protein